MPSFQNGNLCTITYDAVRTAMKGQPYRMGLTSEDARVLMKAVNQGIDSHLEACYCRGRGDSYEWDGHRLLCVVSPESLPVLVRRLFEDDDDAACCLAEDILGTLGFDEGGRIHEDHVCSSSHPDGP